jgi:hypothetical protein
MAMLLDFNLVHVALHLIHELLGSKRGFHDGMNVSLIVLDHPIVVLSKFL